MPSGEFNSQEIANTQQAYANPLSGSAAVAVVGLVVLTSPGVWLGHAFLVDLSADALFDQ